MITFIQDYIAKHVEAGEQSRDIARVLGVSVSMVSAYKKWEYNPSIDVAKKVYKDFKVVLHPFAEESLQHELGDK